jgi:nitric oxide reductase large subunit
MTRGVSGVAHGRRRAEQAARASSGGWLRHLALLGVGAVLAAAAWLFLVRAAIDFGRAARVDGEASLWLLTVGSSIGAVLCLLLAFVLVARARAGWAASSHYTGSHRL